jgi:hypothetical protein
MTKDFKNGQIVLNMLENINERTLYPTLVLATAHLSHQPAVFQGGMIPSVRCDPKIWSKSMMIEELNVLIMRVVTK